MFEDSFSLIPTRPRREEISTKHTDRKPRDTLGRFKGDSCYVRPSPGIGTPKEATIL